MAVSFSEFRTKFPRTAPLLKGGEGSVEASPGRGGGKVYEKPAQTVEEIRAQEESWIQEGIFDGRLAHEIEKRLLEVGAQRMGEKFRVRDIVMAGRDVLWSGSNVSLMPARERFHGYLSHTEPEVLSGCEFPVNRIETDFSLTLFLDQKGNVRAQIGFDNQKVRDSCDLRGKVDKYWAQRLQGQGEE